ncbi:MAG TPA: hypothetical protein VHG51_11975, partial [Longimicrobiaceae bacterium]|nr:hypothetical protein [Longimicrobiaceae bacterium]
MTAAPGLLRPPGAALLLCLLLALALPAAAQGATLERFPGIPNTMLLSEAQPEANLIVVEDRRGSVVITDHAGPLSMKRAFGCLRLDERSARCWLTKRVALDLGESNDVANIATAREVWLDGGAGDDR